MIARFTFNQIRLRNKPIEKGNSSLNRLPMNLLMMIWSIQHQIDLSKLVRTKRDRQQPLIRILIPNLKHLCHHHHQVKIIIKNPIKNPFIQVIHQWKI